MNIGIIGAGNVGGSLGKALAAKGHQVRFGVRDVEKAKPLVDEIGANASVGSIAEAVRFSEVVVLAVRPDGLQEIVAQGGDWSGKVVIDAMNRFSGSAESLGEEVARLIPDANVVKALNTIGAEHYGQPQFGGQKATMFICGDDVKAKSVAARLAEELGFEVVDAGKMSDVRMLEELARLWVHLAYKVMGTRNIAFRLLRR